MRTLRILLLGLALAACTPSPLMTGAPVQVKAGELHKFWIPARTERDVNVPKEAQEKRIPGSVVVEYLIDSDGNVLQPTVVSADPPGLYNEAALNLIRGQRFRPASSNPDRLPVQTKTEITFNQPGGN